MFKDNDIICFFGDSITANGLWIAEVYQAIRKKCKVKCFNSGVSGASAERAALYIHERCLSFNPDYVVMMYGINDIKIPLYKKDLEGDEENEARKKNALLTYRESYEGLIKEAMASGAKVILCIPTPYDDKNIKEEELLECRPGLEECANHLRALAEKYDCPLVDFNAVMDDMLTKRDILSKDRIHPTPEGHHVMAQIFLKETGMQDSSDFDTPFAFEEWNKERYDAEQELHLVNFVEFGVFLKEGRVERMSYEARKNIAKERYDSCEDKTGFFARAYSEYINKIDSYGLYMKEIIKKTVF